jgi:hypothetical protein
MSFPLQVGSVLVPDPPALAALVRRDASPGGGTVVPGLRPAQWVMELVTSGALERRLAIGLAAALIQHPEPVTVCEGARLSANLGEGVLGAVVLRALAGHDMALLLQTDPQFPDSSVEDTLLGAATRICQLSDPQVRRPLLERLRNAGLPALEIPVLCAHGDLEDLAFWLPAVLAEGVSEREMWLVADRIRRDPEAAPVIAEVLREWPHLAAQITAMVARPS